MTTTRRHFLHDAAVGAAGASLLGCMKASAQAKAAGPPSVMGAGSLRAHAAARGLLYGAAVNMKLLASNEAYAALIREQCNIVVAENAMKWGPMRPTIDTYFFDEADALVAFAEKNKMKVRGHNLCWHRQIPKWFDTEATTANAQKLLTEHIEHVVGRYAGRMHSWDVVNEAVLLSDGRADGLRDSPWLKLVGADYIEAAFHAARAADPKALLTYNEYGIEGDDEASEKKRAAVMALLRRMKARNVPLDAVGIQSHITAAGGGLSAAHTYGAGMSSFMAEATRLGLQIFITEMDVNDRELPADEALRDDAVAALYGSYLNLTLREPAVRAVLTWGITDRVTWLNNEGSRKDKLPERCLPFDANNAPAKAFFAMRDAFDKRAAR